MKSKSVVLDGTAAAVFAALSSIDEHCLAAGLPAEQSDKLRLLGEEMIAVVSDILLRCSGKFWLEDNSGSYELHLTANAPIDDKEREALLSVSTSGQNKEVRGIGKAISVLFSEFLYAGNGSCTADYMMYGGYLGDIGPGALAVPVGTMWSLREFEKNAPEEKFAELADASKSIIARYADDVTVSVKTMWVEMVVTKKF